MEPTSTTRTSRHASRARDSSVTDRTDRTGPPTVDASLPRPTRRRLVVYWIVAVVFLFLLTGRFLAEMPAYFLVPVTVWGGWGMSAEIPTHNVHSLMLALTMWVIIFGVAVQVHRPERRIGSAYVYAIAGVVVLGSMLALGAVPAEAVPILAGAAAFSVAAFLAHPSPLAAKFRSIGSPNALLAALLGVAVIPLLAFSVDSFATHLASGPGDEHYEFGHWAFMGIYPIVAILVGAVSAVKVSGWRLAGWVAAILVASHGLVSLVAPAASALGTLWSVLAIAWGGAVAVVVELEARRPAGDPVRR
jgi:hypothetical protein